MTTFPLVRSLNRAIAHSTCSALLALSALASVHAGVAQPSSPASAREVLDANGTYTLQDGRELVLRARGEQFRVTLGEQPSQTWDRVGVDRLRSPDGQKSLQLHREPGGRVDRITLESRSR